MWLYILTLAAAAVLNDAAGPGAARLVCYVENARANDFSECTHLVYAGDARGDKLDVLLKEYRKNNPRLKIVLRVAEVDKDLRTLLKSKHVQGLEIKDAHKSLNKTTVLETIESARSALTSSGGGPLFLALPANPELLAKYYDLRVLVKKVDLMMVQTHALGQVKKMTYHPSRLSGLWDMMNTDSVVDLVVGLGVPASKVVISLPATGRRFTLVNESLSTPGSPAEEDQPKEIDQAELCRLLQKGRWTLERDQDLSAPYAFKDKTWISFEDSSSVDVKGKYARVRGLAGLALHNADKDTETPCGPTLKAALAKVLNQQSRAPRAAVLRSLEHEILSAPAQARALDALQVSPYRITQVVDSDGVIHSIREDTRTEFSCSRQGYFVHPRSCARFYRCVKFDQLSPEFTVFEFDCPAGLAFDSRYEVCVWPGSLPHTQACPGSSEIAPVPQTRFVCPEHEGYYADPENCRWFFACLDHGKAPLTAYEFRCPFGLGFDEHKLKCDWPWLVPACGNIARYEAEVHGYSGAILTGAVGFQGQTADAINVAAHNSLVSGASLNNLVGIQGGVLTKDDALDSNFIASQELQGNYHLNGGNYQTDNGLTYQDVSVGLVQPTKYNDEEKYTSGSIILDDYRLPTKKVSGHSIVTGHGGQYEASHSQNGGFVDQSAGHIVASQAQYEAGHSQSGFIDQSAGHIVADGFGHGGYALQSDSHGQISQNGGYSIHQTVGQDLGQSHSHGAGQEAILTQSEGEYTIQSGSQYSEGQSHSAGSQEYSQISGQAGGYSIQNAGQYSEGVSHSENAGQNSGAYILHQTVGHDAGHGSISGLSLSGHNGEYSGHNEGYTATTAQVSGSTQGHIQNAGQYSGYNGYSSSSFSLGSGQKSGQYSHNYDDNSGAYIHDPTGDTAEPYKHEDAPAVPYVHDDSKYKQTGDYYDYSKYNQGNDGKYSDNSGQYVHDNSGDYKGGNGEYSYSGYVGNEGKYDSGVYRADGHIGSTTSGNVVEQYNGYSTANAGNYLSDSKAYTGASHTLTAGAVNVGLVGKTKLVDVNYNDQFNYQGGNDYNSVTKSEINHNVVHHTLQPGYVANVAQPAVSISHVGTDAHNLDGYSFVTTPTSSGVPTTATPFAVTTALPAYKTTFVPEAPKTSIKEVFGYSQPEITHVQPTVVAIKHDYVPQVKLTDYNQGSYQYESKDYSAGYKGVSYQQENKEYSGYDAGISVSQAKTESKGYDYSKPSIKFEDGVTYTTAAPVVSVSTYKPQGFSHNQNTIHKVESVGFEYSTPTPIVEEPFKKVVAYTTGPSITYEQPTVASYTPQSFSHQTIHKVEGSKVYTPSVGESGYTYEEPKAIEVTTAQPAISVQPVVSTYRPQVFSHQTVHKVEAGRVDYSQHNAESGYEYQQPAIKFEEPQKSYVEYTTAAPVVSTYKPQVYSHQTIHKVETQKYVPVSSTPKVELTYHQSPVTVYENPILKYTENVTPAPFVQQTYKPLSFGHQTIHKVESSQSYAPVEVGNSGYEISKSVNYEQPQTVIHYTTPQPIAVQPAISTYQPQVFSQQTLHKVDASKVNTYSQESESGYSYEKPAVQLEEGHKTVVEYSTPAPIVSTYKPQTYSHQTIHKVETQKYIPVSTPAPQVEVTYQGAEISDHNGEYQKVSYENTHSYQPVVHQHEVQHIVSQPVQQTVVESHSGQNLQLNQEGYSYSQPEIQRNVETLSSGKSYSDASVVSHQVFHQSHVKDDYESGKGVVFVSTSPSTLAYEDHYVEYEAPKKVETYKAPEYIPPKSDYQESYTVSTASTPIVQHQSSVIHKSEEYEYKPVEYSQQYETQKSTPVQVSFSTSHESNSKGSLHLSTFPGTTITTKYKQVAYETPEIQVQEGYKAEEYLPPVVSTVSPPVVSTYKPSTYSTVSSTKEYLPPSSSFEYQSREYLPPSTTAKPVTQAPIHIQSTTYKAPDYLPPLEQTEQKVVNFESFGYKNDEFASQVNYNPYQEYTVSTAAPVTRKQNIVVETAKSHLLGFGTVGPDAGLVSPVTYTTAAPIVKTQAPYRIKSTTYKAPEYLPPNEDISSQSHSQNFEYKNYEDSSSGIAFNTYQEPIVVSTSAPVTRKQNIVVETAKSHLLGYGTVGSDAGLVSSASYSTSSPAVSSTGAYSVSSTYAPIKQELVEVTPPTVPLRRTKPKVAVVTKINDFNPLLVRKLGAVCSCQSPVLILKGKRPNARAQQEYDDYSNDDYNRGDNDNYSELQSHAVTPIPAIPATFNPIIVPDDSFYQDYQESNSYSQSSSKDAYSQNHVSSTPVAVSTTEKIVRVRPRVKSVTPAPTYKTILLKEEVAPTVVAKEASAIESQAFDRYGPGGWRSRDETLQGSVDCQRAGLFRHPKQCNKFYACRWDCTKQRFTLHVFNCPIQLSFDPSIGACNWPSQGPACQGDTLLTNTL